MAEKSIIKITTAPDAIGPYSQGVKYGDFVFISGQIPIHPATNKLVEGDIAEQTRQCLENIKNILESTGGSLFNVLKTTIYLASLDDFEEMNKVYGEYFPHDPPARSTVEVARLPKGAKIEIEAIAYIPESKAGGGLIY